MSGTILRVCRRCNKSFLVQPNQIRRNAGITYCSQFCSIRKTHGMTNSPEYHTWESMLARCYHKSHSSHKHYAAKGIIVCERWRTSFDNFYADMGRKPLGYSLDRIDNYGNYEPGNCRWATSSQQQRNKSSTIFLTYNGVIKSVSDWADLTGISPNAIRLRIRNGWAPEKILTTPVQIRH